MALKFKDWPHTGATRAAGADLVIRCACGREDVVSHARIVPPEAAKKWASSKGWQIGRRWKSATCPTCVKRQEDKDMMKKKEAASRAAKTAQRKAILLMADHYQEVGRRYSEGWSDKRIGGEVGLSAEAVAAVREDYYGPLEDPQITSIRADVEKLREEAGEQFKTLADLAHSTRADLLKRADELATRIAKIGGRHG